MAYTVETRDSGAAGLSALDQEPFDVILTDLRMPDITGMDVLRHVRERLPDAAVIMITGHATVDSAIDAMKAGAFHYIAKPFRIDEVREIVRQGRFVIAVCAGLVSYGLMSFLMTAAPLAMVGCGLPIETAALGISWHILAMFAPAFFTGRLIERFGKETITAIGLVMIAIAAAINLGGLSVAHFWGGLILLGVGWNFGFIGATAMVTDCHRPEESAKVQGANDFLVFGSVAIASFSAGKLLDVGLHEIGGLVHPGGTCVIRGAAENLVGRLSLG
jgi:CheY-like chemotaxis protein